MGAQHMKPALLTKQRAAALSRVYDGGPGAWCEGFGRAGGAVSRMFDDMARQGLVSRAPHVVTTKGLQALMDWNAQHDKAHR